MSALPGPPETAKGRPARIEPDQFPFRFPRSPRRLGGTLSVKEVAARLQRMAAFHRMLLRTLAGWIIQIPEFEVKIEVAHHLYMHGEAARGMRQRLETLRISAAAFEDFRDEEVLLVTREIELSHDAAELIVATHCVLAKQLLEAERRLEQLTDSLADLPTIRLLRQIRVDLLEMCEWGEAVVNAYAAGGIPESGLDEWKAHLESLLRHVGGVMGDQERCERPTLRQDSSPPFRRAMACARDDRFTTFHHTRDYRKADELNGLEQGEYERERLEMIRVQRDEIDAIETFANVLYDMPSASFDFQLDLARFIWDEARHAEIGQQSLALLGFEPFKVPCGVIGINVRSPLASELALAQISIFGELNMVSRLRRVSEWANQQDDKATSITFDFIHADELIHLRRGRQWLKTLRGDGDLVSLQQETKAIAIKRLLEEGVVGEDYAMNLTVAEISQLIGE